MSPRGVWEWFAMMSATRPSGGPFDAVAEHLGGMSAGPRGRRRVASPYILTHPDNLVHWSSA